MTDYTVIETLPDGTELRQYENGYIRNQNGQIMQLPDELQETKITKETTEHYRTLRKNKILSAIESKLQDVTKTSLPSDAIAAIVGKRAEIAMKDETRTGNEAAKIVLSAVDAYQDKSADTTTTIRNEYVMDADTMALITRMAEARRRTNVLDAVEITTKNIDNT